MPIKARIDMLATGLRTPVGVKLLGRDHGQMEAVARQVEATVSGTTSAHAERVIGLEDVPDRGKLAVVVAVSPPIAVATACCTGAIASNVLVPTLRGGMLPLGQLADVKLTQGATMIRTENGQLAVYVLVDFGDRDLAGYVADTRRAVQEKVVFPSGTYAVWSGQFGYLERAKPS